MHILRKILLLYRRPVQTVEVPGGGGGSSSSGGTTPWLWMYSNI